MCVLGFLLFVSFCFVLFFPQRGEKWNLSIALFGLHFSSHKISVIVLPLSIANVCFCFHTLSRVNQRDEAK